MSSLIQQEWATLVPAGTSVRYFDHCTSTNSVATEAAVTGLQGPTWFVASKQSAGRGRRGRAWTSGEGNLYCSLSTRLNVKIADLSTLPYVVSLAVRDCFIDLGCDSASVRCKWPNDVLVDEHKASGILIESSAGQDQTIDFVVIGIGLNLASYPNDAQFPATSLQERLRKRVAVTEAFKSLAFRLNERLGRWQPKDVSGLIEEWRAVSWGLGHRREIRTVDESFMATLTGLNNQGGLMLTLDDGSTRTLYAGDVFASPRPT